jgi:hypothetical protein
MSISTEGKLAILVGLLGLGGAGAIMVAPDHTEIGWVMIGTAALGGIMLGAHHFRGTLARLWTPSDKQRMISLICMIIFGLGFVGSAGVYFWPKSAAPPEPKAQAESIPPQAALPSPPTTIPDPAEDPLPRNAKFRYHGKVYWAAPRPYIKVQAEEMQKTLQEVYDSINKKSEPIVASWDGPAVMFTRNWLSIVQTEGRQSAIVKLDDIRNQVISAYTELREILKRRPYYRQDISSIIDDHGEVGDMNGAINDYKAALAALPDKPKPTTDLIDRVIGPSEVKFEMAITKYTNWISAFNTKTLQLREELDALTNE